MVNRLESEYKADIQPSQRAVFDVRDVHKSFAGLQALSEVNLQVGERTTHAIIGPNGAGKSTLLNVCVGRLAPDTGTVTFNGETLTGKKPYEINQAGVARVFQTPEIFSDLNLLENLMMPALSKRDGYFTFNAFRALNAQKDILQKSERALEDVGLIDKRFEHAGSLSRGDKRRLELAMCLIQDPKLLLLDEPTAGMSRHDTNRTIDLLVKIKESGMTIIVIEHDMHVVFSLADHVSVLAQGKIIAAGTPSEVKGSPKVQEAYLGGAAQ
nr:ABC transporter ATP-binding protein [uncultured Halomonas sp.]